MEKEIKINDKIKIDDDIQNVKHNESPVKGIVRIYQDDKLIYEKHNTVVYSGRYLLFYLFKQYFGTNTADNNNNISNSDLFLNLSYSKDNYAITTPDLTLNDITSEADTLIYSKCDIITDPFNLINANEKALNITFKISVDGDDSAKKINQIFLTYNKPTTSTEEQPTQILFSRVALDPIYLGANSKFNISYTLYF